MFRILNLIPKVPVLMALMLSVACSTDNENSDVRNDELGELPNVEEIQIFPATHPLNTEVANKAMDPNSQAILENIGLDKHLFTDFGSGLWEGTPIGIPFVVVAKDQPKVPITYRGNGTDGNYGDESDPGPFPIPLSAPVEGNGSGDSHVISVDLENGMLYELYNAQQVGDGWEASSGAVFNLNAIDYRPKGWTSADAAGLPIFPLLVRYGEIEKGEIDHPIRFTLNRSKIYAGYVNPARHLISGATSSNLLPMGGILRLKANFDISGFSATNQIILKAMKKYGIMLADAGSNMFISGDPNKGWDNDDLRQLQQVRVSNFEVVKMGEIYTN